jgi:predicted nucleic acid-binding protein
MTKQSRLLAIDASVLRSAGAKEGHSSHCAALLSSVLEICHRTAFSSEIKVEWDKHQSRFSIKWRASMVARKKMVPVSIQGRQSALMGQIEAQPGMSMQDRAALKKDAHMLASAMEADRVIVTGDQNLKNLADGTLGLSLEWLLVHQNDTALQRQQLMARLVDMSRNKPNPPLPS